MDDSYEPEVERVVRIVGNAFNTGTIFESEDDIRAVMNAVEAGLLKLVKHRLQAFRVRDRSRNIFMDVELTSPGLLFLGYDEKKYYSR